MTSIRKKGQKPMNKTDFHKGQKVYLYSLPSARYSNTGPCIFERQVISVGSKYITVADANSHIEPIKFDIHDDFRQKTDYSPSYKLYLSEQDIYDDIERKQLFQEIKERFSFRNQYKLSTLKQISALLDADIDSETEN